MRLDQYCFYATHDWQADAIKTMLGLHAAPWVNDHVEMLTKLPDGAWYDGAADLQFCEALGPQVEIMRWVKGPHWNILRDTEKYFMAHIGMHLDDDEDWPSMAGGTLLQENKTISHSGAAFNDPASPQYGRRYHYRIYLMPQSEHLYVKLIKRVHRA